MQTEQIYGARRFFGLADVAGGATITATIEAVSLSRRPDPSGLTPGNLRLVLTLTNHERKLALSRRNAGILATAWGDEPDKWPGRRVTLYGLMEPWRGAMRPALRVRPADPDLERRPGFANAARAALSSLFDGGAK